MAEKVDLLLQDAQALRSVVEKYKTEFSERGYGDSRIAAFDAAIANVLSLDSAQKSAQETLRQKTEEQDDTMERGYAIIVLTQNAAKASYGRDKVALKEFRIGVDRPRGVKDMITTLEYFTGVVQRHSVDLLANGMAQSDAAELSNAYAALVAADAVQENAKKLRNAATATRDKAVKTLDEEVFKARKFAKARFAGDNAKLEEFKPIARTGGKKKKEEPPPAKA